MKRWVIVGALLFFTPAADAEIINISGKIVKEGTSEGIAGARVTLKHYSTWITVDTFKTETGKLEVDHYNSIVSISDANGNFHLGGNTAVTVNPLLNRDNGIVIRSMGNGAGLLVKSSYRNTPVGIDLYRIDGRRVDSKRFINSNSGVCFLPLPHTVSVMYVVKVSTVQGSALFKTVPGMGIVCPMISQTASAAGSLGKRAASISDSLVVTKGDYRTALQAIQKYDLTDISIPIMPSQPWVQSGALEHQGGMVKILAKGHDFEMGQPCDTVRGIYFSSATTDVEQPVHTVSFAHDFWMDTVEVQQGEFDSLMKKTYSKYKGNGWNASNGMGPTVAVYSVLWGDAALFCNARSKVFGLPDTAYSYSGIRGQVGFLCTLKNVSVNLSANAYRLPTEAEWEYACRGGTSTDFYWGKNLKDYPLDTMGQIESNAVAEISNYVVWYYNSFGLGKDTTEYGAHVTGQRKPNKYGLYDMLGNVSEWCNEWLDYGWGAVTDPTSPPRDYQALRGGNWGNDITHIRATDREYAPADYPYFFMGFRVVRQIN